MSATHSPEAVVRRYLAYLDDPSALVDDEAVKAAAAAVHAASDMIDRLKALTALEAAQTVDPEGLETEFTAVAKEFADAAGISAGAFAEVGVSLAVLAAAGFDTTGLRSRATASRGRTPRRSGGERRRAPSVSVAVLTDFITSTSEPFTFSTVADAVGGSPASIRKAVEDLLAAGRVTKLGPDPDRHSRGRAPSRYQYTG